MKKMFEDTIVFSQPYMILEGDRADSLLELIEMEDYKNTQLKVNDILSSVKNSSYIELDK